MITLLALLSTLSGGVLIYLASAQQRLRASALPAAARHAGWLLVVAGAAIWWYDAGMGPGISAALTMLTLTWVALPYAAWWRAAAAETGE